MTNKTKLIGPFNQVVTCDNLPLKGALSDDLLEVIPQGGVVVSDGCIVATDSYEALLQQYPDAEKEEIEPGHVLLPGFIDCHTHITFGGNRARDYSERLAGVSYMEIARRGGGIQESVRGTRAATRAELAELTKMRANDLLSQGVTTIEAKSGYGLNKDEELKILYAIRDAAAELDADIIPTCLAAHLKPADFEGTNREYLEHMVNDLFPVLKAEQLTNRIDIFTEETAFNVEDSTWYLQEAKKQGFDITVHADQFTTGGSAMAVELGALSAEHLEASGDEEIALLAQSDTVATVLPGASLGLGMHFSPARKLLDGGCCVAISSDWNPGTAPMGELLIQTALLGAYEKLTLTECLAGITVRAAKALNLTDRGALSKGLLADMQMYPTDDYQNIFYLQGSMKPDGVWRKGTRVLG